MKKNLFLKNVKKTWSYIKGARKHLVFYGIISIVEGVISAILPIIGAKIILGITNGLVEQLLSSAILMLVIDMILNITFSYKGKLYQKIYFHTLVNLQTEVAKETLKLEIKEIDTESSGVFIDRLNKDTEDISGIFMEYTYWTSHVIANLGVLVAIFLLNKYMFIYTVIVAIAIFFIDKTRLSKQYKIQKNLKRLSEKKTGLTSELVRGIRDIKVLNASETALKQTTEKIVEATKEATKMQDIRRLYNFIEDCANSIFDYLFILIGIILYKKGLLIIPTFVIIYNYRHKIKYLLSALVQILEYNKKFIVAAERIYEIIDNERFSKEKFGDIQVKKLEGNIRFDDVSFAYNENKPILKHMSFEIKPNEKVAFVGKSGEGKTTIFNLITRMYQVNEGTISLDDYPIDSLTGDTIRNNMSIITQNPYIFNFSIKENLLLAKENATMKEIRNACKIACIDDYIMSLENKYDTMVGENGVILSGGQKQRLAIARALLMKTEIILFDEATSALDNETQSKIQEAIENLKGEYTILIVAHRLDTVIDCDKIFVVGDGQIKGCGTHKELLKTCPLYQNLYQKELEE